MDLVYIVRDGANEELRYSLRSVAKNLPHARVWVFGGGPDWLTGVERVRIAQTGEKYDNAMKLFAAIRQHPKVSTKFVVMNDDMFIMEPLLSIPTEHWGPLEAVVERHRATNYRFYLQGMENTLELLRELGYENPLSYELHTPMVMTKTGLRRVQNLLNKEKRSPLHNRTLYGNLYDVGGEYADDVKVYDINTVPKTPLLSTSDYSFTMGLIGQRIRERFHEPSQYELPV